MKQILTILLLFSVFSLFGQYKSPFNQRQVKNDSTNAYSFIVSGHFYGGKANNSGFPVNTLLANLDWINSSNSAMLVCLGDLFKDVSNDIPNYEASLFNKLNIPLVNTVGNHDLTGTIYQDNYGQTAFFFELNNDIHLILDTERDDGDISGEQLDLLNEVLEKVTQNNSHNVFIYLHRTIWKNAYPKMDGLFGDNTQAIGGNNFKSEVLPILNKIGKKANIYLFSGSLGTAPASFFNYHDKENNITIIATAIRGLPRDAMLNVFVNNKGEVSFETKSLTGQKLENLANYNVDFWQNESGAEPFNWRLVPYYMKQTITHRYFWYGAILSFLGVFSLRFIWNRRKKKNKGTG